MSPVWTRRASRRGTDLVSAGVEAPLGFAVVAPQRPGLAGLGSA